MLYRFSGAAKHEFLFLHLLKRIGEKYLARKEAVPFILDLVSVNASSLMSIETDSEDDKKVQTTFQEYLRDYCLHCTGESVLQYFPKIKEKVTNI